MAIVRAKTFEEQRVEQKASLERIRNGLATRVRILVPYNACPVCRAAEGAYEFDEVPELPLDGCANGGSCNTVYAPVLDLFGP